MKTEPQKKYRKLMFSVTANDCKWDFIRGSGKGGQARNKTSNAVRCTHIESKAVGYCEEERSQRQNRERAFEKMAKTKEFRLWVDLKMARLTGEEKRIEDIVRKEMRNIKVEVKDKGRWKEVPKDDPLLSEEEDKEYPPLYKSRIEASGQEEPDIEDELKTAYLKGLKKSD